MPLKTDLVALDAAGGELLLIAPGAVDLLFARDERLSADRPLAHTARETLLVPLARFVLHLLGACGGREGPQSDTGA